MGDEVSPRGWCVMRDVKEVLMMSMMISGNCYLVIPERLLEE